MSPRAGYPPEVEARLRSVYDEMMWLAQRTDTTAAAARSWYTHVAAVALRNKVRIFTGLVSKKALRPGAELRLEHYKRIQTRLTSLVSQHLDSRTRVPEEFLLLIQECERVHIVTRLENHEAMKADGDYRRAGIELVSWRSMSPESQSFLWKRVLQGRVANAAKYKPRD